MSFKFLLTPLFIFLLTAPVQGQTLTPSPSPQNAVDRMQELQRQMDILGQEVQKLKTGSAAQDPVADQSNYGYGPAASKVYRVQQGFSLGGYGEILFESFRGSAFNKDGTVVPGKRVSPGSDYSQDDGQHRFDLSRAVLYAGYRFSDEWVLNSELEWEHGGGEVNVEFLYFDYFLRKELNFRMGKLLIPMGITNEMHEPTTYFSTHRPTLESIIIPSTWAEYGAGAFGDLGPVTYRSYVVTGLNGTGLDPAEGTREARHETGAANAGNLAWVTRADYTGLPGLLAGTSFYLGSASVVPVAGFDTLSLPVKMVEVHGQYNWHALDLRVMGAYSVFSNIDQLSVQRAAGITDSVGSKQGGFYAQAAYDLLNGKRESLSPFVRWEVVDTQVEVPPGYAKNRNNLIRELIAGLNFKPLPQLVFKADYQWYFLGDENGVNQANLSMGYVF